MTQLQPLLKPLAAALVKAKPYLAMIFIQICMAGMPIVALLSLKRGISNYVLVVYIHAAATVAIAPFALYFERKIRPKMTMSVFLKILMLAMIEPVINQNLYYLGMKYTSATFTSVLFNIVPSITFIMALIFRMDKIKFKSRHSQAKILGTVITLGGAIIMSLYKGPAVKMFSSTSQAHSGTSNIGTGSKWALGTVMIIGSCIGWAGFYIVQSMTLEAYPAGLSVTAMIVFLGTILGAIVAFARERHLSAWAVGFDSRLVAPIYSGVVCSALGIFIQGMVMEERGPVFVTAFNPLSMIMVAVLSSLVLAEKLYLGSFIGAFVIVVGLYAVIWGTKKNYVAPPAQTTEKDSFHELPVSVTDVGKCDTRVTVVADPEYTNNGIIKQEILKNGVGVGGSQK